MSFVDEVKMRTIDFLRSRKRAYELTFSQGHGQFVLRDLAHFCKAGETTFDENPIIAARYAGRREVMLRIQKHLNLTSEELFAIYSGSAPIKGDKK